MSPFRSAAAMACCMRSSSSTRLGKPGERIEVGLVLEAGAALVQRGDVAENPTVGDLAGVVRTTEVLTCTGRCAVAALVLHFTPPVAGAEQALANLAIQRRGLAGAGEVGGLADQLLATEAGDRWRHC